MSIVPAKRGRANSYQGPQTVYVVLQRTSEYVPRGDSHDVSCVSVHTTLAAANQAAKSFMEVDDDDKDVQTQMGWSSWEDLLGTRIQTDSEGKVRVISLADTQGESLVWVEKKTVEDDSDDEESESEGGVDGDERNAPKRLKASGDSPNDVIDLTED